MATSLHWRTHSARTKINQQFGFIWVEDHLFFIANSLDFVYFVLNKSILVREELPTRFPVWLPVMFLVLWLPAL